MLFRESPYHGEDEDEIYDAILDGPPSIPSEAPHGTRSLLERLLVRDPDVRLGSERGADEVMEQEYFEEIDWRVVMKAEGEGPYLPHGIERGLFGNYDMSITSVAPSMSPVQTGKDLECESCSRAD